MPDLNDGLEAFQLNTNNFGFSAEKVENLEATEYTLATILVDTSSSTSPFRDEMRQAIDKVVEACSKSPRSDNLMLRVCEFGSNFNENHGFKKLSSVSKGDYSSQFNGGGMTALYDATENAVTATESYGKNLTENDFDTNGIIFIITDGMENTSKATINTVKDAFKHVVSSEALESLVSVLIGVNVDPQTDSYLQQFKTDAGITQYINIGDATPGNLAKLADFVSRSISSQSQSLGSGGPSQSLAF